MLDFSNFTDLPEMDWVSFRYQVLESVANQLL